MSWTSCKPAYADAEEVDPVTARPRGSTVRRDAGLYGYERALGRAELTPVAGVDEAGRGACAGPLVAGAVILPAGKRGVRSEEHTSELQSRFDLVCRLL